jgi:hypothetical protein
VLLVVVNPLGGEGEGLGAIGPVLCGATILNRKQGKSSQSQSNARI